PALRRVTSRAVALNSDNDLTFVDAAIAKRSIDAPSPNDLISFVRRQALDAHAAADTLGGLSGASDVGKYPPTGLADRLRLVARLMKADLGAQVYYPTHSGYDTHA